ncbi:MAG: DNA recombination protein RmuC, partial [Sphingomonas sp.]|nr:DNA recombination protein RmuC [Sphingomonas sp.]
MDSLTIILMLVAVAAGALIGWLFGSRGGEQGKATAEALRLQLDEVVKERDSNRAAAQELVALKAAGAEREKAFDQRLAELKEAKDALTAQFAEVGGQLLEQAQKQFLDRADQRFQQSEEKSGSNLKALLQPVHDRLQKYEEAVTKVEN